VDYKTHWDQVYHSKEVSKLGWHEDTPLPSINLIEKSGISKNARILQIGAGASTLIDHLFKSGFTNQIATDISSVSLGKLENRLGPNLAKNVEWIVDDVVSPRILPLIEPVDLWHDRAVLHFFNENWEKRAYFNLLLQLVKINGFVIIAVFNLDGAPKCSGLPVSRYNEQMLQEKLGDGFKLIESFNYLFKMPSGDKRPYVYTLFKRIG